MLSLSAEWLKKTLGHRVQSIYPALWASLSGDAVEGKPVGHMRSMTLAEKDMARQLSDPPVEQAALPFWYAAKVTEILALHLFRPADESGVTGREPFCVTRKRTTTERVDKVMEWIDSHMEESLDLKRLANHVGCAPHYLSRLFSRETGNTISQYLRAVRIERAAELLDAGRHNVTEAAIEVGYNSLSHFTKAFVQEKGLKPSVYLTQVSE
ncbi:helix-turn-helix domain-containing protein [Oceaniferula spumae]